MSFLEAILLGTIQGLTEFLPVSSSGHLVLIQNLLPSFSQPGVLFDVILHSGTLLAVIVYFWQDIFKIKLNYLLLLFWATIPVVITGFLFSNLVESFFLKPTLVGAALLFTGIMNLLTDQQKTTKDNPQTKDALTIGFFQALALVPGISRSGSTIFAGVFSKVKRQAAARFSFLLSVPAIIGANFLQILKYQGEIKAELTLTYFLGFLSAFVAGIIAIYLVIKILCQRKFSLFGIYCLLLGTLVLFF